MSTRSKKISWPVNPEQAAHMKMRKQQNMEVCVKNPNENWMFDILTEQTGLKWTRQAQWGFRLFDFWNAKLGIAVEVDGNSHDLPSQKRWDAKRDAYNLERSAIIVLRVRNRNEKDAEQAITTIRNSKPWIERRRDAGVLTKAEQKSIDKKEEVFIVRTAARKWKCSECFIDIEAGERYTIRNTTFGSRRYSSRVCRQCRSV